MLIPISQVIPTTSELRALRDFQKTSDRHNEKSREIGLSILRQFEGERAASLARDPSIRCLPGQEALGIPQEELDAINSLPIGCDLECPIPDRRLREEVPTFIDTPGDLANDLRERLDFIAGFAGRGRLGDLYRGPAAYKLYGELRRRAMSFFKLAPSIVGRMANLLPGAEVLRDRGEDTVHYLRWLERWLRAVLLGDTLGIHYYPSELRRFLPASKARELARERGYDVSLNTIRRAKDAGCFQWEPGEGRVKYLVEVNSFLRWVEWQRGSTASDRRRPRRSRAGAHAGWAEVALEEIPAALEPDALPPVQVVPRQCPPHRPAGFAEPAAVVEAPMLVEQDLVDLLPGVVGLPVAQAAPAGDGEASVRLGGQVFPPDAGPEHEEGCRSAPRERMSAEVGAAAREPGGQPRHQARDIQS